MSEHTGIEWTDHTFNPWWGCVKVSPACHNCYAETLSHRYGFKVWGPGTERRFFSDAHWKEPLRWNKQAQAEGRRQRVFCASMADVFEVPFSGPDNGRELRDRLDRERSRLWLLIERTPHLEWLLLTKRPEYVMGRVPRWWAGGFPDNVEVGTTAETQGWLEERLMELLGIPAAVRFFSIEPMLGEMNLRRVRHKYELGEVYVDALTGATTEPIMAAPKRGVQWVIAGGESGPGHRPPNPLWLSSVRDQCEQAGVPFFFKQWGGLRPKTHGAVLDGHQYKQFPVSS